MRTWFPRLSRYGAVNSHDLLKAAAILLMVMDHVGLYGLQNRVSWMRIIGRASGPAFFFVTGYARSYRFKWNIFYYGVILSVLYYFLFHFYLNILLNFIIIKALLEHYNPAQSKTFVLILLFGLLAAAAPAADYLEYGTLGILFACAGSLLAQQDERGFIWLLATVIVYFLMNILYFKFPQNLFDFNLLIVTLAIMLCIFLLYRFKTFKFSQPAQTVVLFLSRYSLEIYFWHLLLIYGCYYWIMINYQSVL